MENKKNSPSLLIAGFAIMFFALIVVIFLYFDQRKESRAAIAQLQQYSGMMESKKDSLENELNGIIVQYDALKSDNDTINKQLTLQQEKIKKLLSMRISDTEKIKRYEKELLTIRDVLKSYIVQIDSLNTKNQILLVENKDLKNTGAKLENKNKKLEQEKEELTSIKIEAKTLIAASITPVALNKRSKEQDRADKVTKIRVDFTLRKNTVADAGAKIIYLRLIRPDAVVLGSKEAGVFDYENTQIPFSASREVNYEKNDLPVSIFWDNNGDLIKGNNICELYCEGKLIGRAEFTLR
jgi:FtsZ-binding cell division protein ZapB